jgi:hypothetical protein
MLCGNFQTLLVTHRAHFPLLGNRKFYRRVHRGLQSDGNMTQYKHKSSHCFFFQDELQYEVVPTPRSPAGASYFQIFGPLLLNAKSFPTPTPQLLYSSNI